MKVSRAEALAAAIAQIEKYARQQPAEPIEMPLIERMRAQLFVWEDNEPDEEKWDTVQREYAEAFFAVAQAEALYRELAKRPVPILSLEEPF